jgi:hypothetical protein
MTRLQCGDNSVGQGKAYKWLGRLKGGRTCVDAVVCGNRL